MASLPHGFSTIGTSLGMRYTLSATAPKILDITSAASIDEGSSLTVTVTTTNIPNSTSLNWSVTNAGDFNTSSGTVTITNNTGTFTVTPTADATTEGNETFTATVSGTVSGTAVTRTSGSLLINDTSLTPAAPVIDTVSAPVSIDEGSAGTVSVSTSNVPNGTVLNWSLSNAGDFGTSSGTVTINSNAGSFSVTPTADSTTEGPETFVVTVSGTVSGTAVTKTSGSVTINDTSTAPAYIPAGTDIGRINSSGIVAYADSYHNDGQGSFADAELTFEFSRDSNGFKIEIYDGGSSGSIVSSKWYNTSSTLANLSTSSSPTTLYTNTSAVPSAIRMVWTQTDRADQGDTGVSINDGTYVEGNWLTTSSDGTNITAKFRSSATAGGVSGFYSRRGTDWVIEFWGRSTGYLDTKLVTYKIQTDAEAEII